MSSFALLDGRLVADGVARLARSHRSLLAQPLRLTADLARTRCRLPPPRRRTRPNPDPSAHRFSRHVPPRRPARRLGRVPDGIQVQVAGE